MRANQSCVCFLLLVGFVMSGAAFSNARLRFAAVLTRHGDRTPLKVFPNTLETWPEGLGILTKVGVKQHHDLGERYRKRYVEDLKLAPNRYHDTNVLVRSTGKQRTLMSAYSFMSGFYPPTSDVDTGLPHGIQPIPIYSESLGEDNLIYNYKSCEKIDILRKEERRKEVWTEWEKKFSPELKELSKIMGKPIKLSDCSTILNNIQAEKIHNRPSIPELVNNATLVHFLETATEIVLRSKYGSREMGQLGVGILLQNLYDRMADKVKGKESHDFVLLSGHDGTVLTLFSALGLTDFAIPHYASSVAFELYAKENSKKEENNAHNTASFSTSAEDYFVSVLYNFKPLILPGCKEVCSLAEFQRVVNESTHSDLASCNPPKSRHDEL